MNTRQQSRDLTKKPVREDKFTLAFGRYSTNAASLERHRSIISIFFKKGVKEKGPQSVAVERIKFTFNTDARKIRGTRFVYTSVTRKIKRLISSRITITL